MWSITSMELPLHTYNPGTISNLFTLEIRNDVGSPGSTVLGSFDTATPLVTSMYSSRFTFAPSAPISLAGGNYWLVMRPTDPDSSDFWQLASSGIEDFAAPGWSIADNFSFSQNGASNWLMNTPDNAPLSHSNLPLTFSFDATQTAVPEPSSFALVADLVGGAWWKRRRVKSQAAIAAVA